MSVGGIFCALRLLPGSLLRSFLGLLGQRGNRHAPRGVWSGFCGRIRRTAEFFGGQTRGLNAHIDLVHQGAGDTAAVAHVRDMTIGELEGRPIHVADHCYGCTAGQGSSCGGALGNDTDRAQYRIRL
jgi:hypothetical protein